MKILKYNQTIQIEEVYKRTDKTKQKNLKIKKGKCFNSRKC